MWMHRKFREVCEKESLAKNEDFARETELLKQNHQYEMERMRQVSSYEINELRELYEKVFMGNDSGGE